MEDEIEEYYKIYNEIRILQNEMILKELKIQ